MSDAPRFLAIDVGSNATRVKTWRLRPDAEPVEESFERHPLRLGAAVFETGRPAEPILNQLTDLLRDAGDALREGKLVAVRAVATSALREAADGETIVRRLRETTGIAIRILTGEQEAGLVALGILGRHARAGRPHLLIDVGGGSTELILTDGADVRRLLSLPLGAVRLRQCWLLEADPPSPESLRRAQAAIAAELETGLAPLGPLDPATEAVGLAGSITTLYRMATSGAMPPAAGGPLSRREVEALRDRLATMRVDAIRAGFTIEPDRAEVILAGGLIVAALIERIGFDRLRVVAGGVADGLLQEHLRDAAERAEQ